MGKLFKQAQLLPWHLWPLLIIILLLLTPVVAVVSSFLSDPAPSWPHLVDTVLLEYSLNSLYLVLGVAFGVLTLGLLPVVIFMAAKHLSGYYFYP